MTKVTGRDPKQVSISYCWQCPYQMKRFLIDDDGFQVVAGATCMVTGEELGYIHYAGYQINADRAFPESCSLEESE